jgi:uncharacterized UBP type Zn finger protein
MISISPCERCANRKKDSKKSREVYSQWTPTGNETAVLQAESHPVACEGRRGLLNLGQTCALNTVLQSFLHNPLLRNYFLSDNHNSRLFSLSESSKFKQCKGKECMCCEMDRLFSEVLLNLNSKRFLDYFTRSTLGIRLLMHHSHFSLFCGVPRQAPPPYQKVMHSKMHMKS